jgi:cell pole-organizing protein PopZ
MSGTPEQEPSIEEILASIRQIISDDDEGAPAASAEPEPVAKPQPAPPPPPPPPAPKEDVLELKDPLPPPARPVIDMEDALDDESDYISVQPVLPDDEDDSILSDTAKSAALSGFSKLAHNIPLERGTTPHRSSDGSTLEDIVRDMLNPMLRVWLDENLPTIIEKLVQKELEKLARRASDD